MKCDVARTYFMDYIYDELESEAGRGTRFVVVIPTVR